MVLWSHDELELAKIAELVMRTRRINFLEIGCYKFQMTMIFLMFSGGNLPQRPLVIANDFRDCDPAKREILSSLFRKIFIFVEGDSHSPETVANITKILRGGQLDILFIDGDHSGLGIEKDTVNYLPLMHPDGFIIWHDIVRGGGEKVHTWFIEKLQKNIQLNMFFEKHSRIAYIQAKEWIRNVQGNPKPEKP